MPVPCHVEYRSDEANIVCSHHKRLQSQTILNDGLSLRHQGGEAPIDPGLARGPTR